MINYKMAKLKSKRAEDKGRALIKAIDSQYAKRNNELRYHLGASEIGHKCERWLWLKFRWIIIPEFSGRMQRLFATGHKWEFKFVEYLEGIGADIRHTTEDQINVDFGSHLSGSLDGIIYSGLPFDIEYPVLSEFKTASAKSFDWLRKNGVKKAQYKHYVQMNMYMHARELKNALYMSECKNDNELHVEVVEYNKGTAVSHIAKGHRIALSMEMPERFKGFPDAFECQYCDALSFCEGDRSKVNDSCRSCKHAIPTKKSEWECSKRSLVIPNKRQKMKMRCHERINI